jgi:uncharacterized protein
MKINLPQALMAGDGLVPFDYTIDLSHEEVHFEHPFSRPVRISGEIRDSAGMIRLDGEIEADVTVSCARCGKPVTYYKRVQVAFMLATALAGDALDDIWVLDGDTLELDDVFVPELIMDMEMAVLCREDCGGAPEPTDFAQK